MALSSQFASAAASAMAGDFTRNMGKAIGKPLEDMSNMGSRMPGHSEINWVHFNYPPLLRLIHYDLDELPSALSGLVRCFNISFRLAVLGCVLNLVDTIILCASTKAPFRWVIQSAIHLLVLPVAGLGVFYAGYRGLAEPDTTLAFRFKVAQPVLAFIYLLFGIVPWGCINGLSQFGDMSDYTDGSVFWTVAVIIESIVWLLNALLATSNVVRAQRYDVYGTGVSAAATSF